MKFCLKSNGSKISFIVRVRVKPELALGLGSDKVWVRSRLRSSSGFILHHIRLCIRIISDYRKHTFLQELKFCPRSTSRFDSVFYFVLLSFQP